MDSIVWDQMVAAGPSFPLFLQGWPFLCFSSEGVSRKSLKTEKIPKYGS
jgi:hypothetical protein